MGGISTIPCENLKYFIFCGCGRTITTIALSAAVAGDVGLMRANGQENLFAMQLSASVTVRLSGSRQIPRRQLPLQGSTTKETN